MISCGTSGKATVLLALLLPIMVGACTTDGLDGITASISGPSTVLPSTDQGRRRFTEEWGRRFAANPGDKVSALAYARGLRALTRYAQAVAVLQQAAIRHPTDHEILGAYGEALVDDGHLRRAATVLSHAHTPARPKWRILSAQGVVADEMGEHAAAQDYYRAALKIVPGEPSVLSNLGLSYLLEKRLDLAEKTMRQAADSPGADARVRQNFALVLTLEGKLAEAKDFERRDTSITKPAANVGQIRQEITGKRRPGATARHPEVRPPEHAVASLGG